MEHFVIPPGATHIRLPYIKHQHYDHGDFHKYPERRGWRKDKLLNTDYFGGHNKARVEAFFQTWLYFGILVSVFKIAGIDIKQSEFMKTNDGQPFLTTELLGDKVEAWKKRWEGEEAKSRYQSAWWATKYILDEVKTYINAFGGIPCPTTDNALSEDSNALAISPVSEKTLMAIVALTYTLVEAAILLYDVQWNAYDQYVNYTTKFLTTQLREAGWCKLDIRRMLTELGIDGHYYFSLLPCPLDKSKHLKCSETQCIAANIPSDQHYETQHVSSCDRGDDLDAKFIAKMTEKVVEIISEGGIPVMSWKEDENRTNSDMLICNALVENIEFVAISHVWADGLGNPHTSSLPKCHLRRIQGLVNKVPSQESIALRYFWMDTLSIPVGESYKPRRKKAIAHMADIYRRSVSVLVLDMWLQKLPVHSKLIDKLARLYVCNWIHRLWTIQESSLATSVYIQFMDGAQLISNITSQCRTHDRKDENSKNWPIYIRFPEQIAESAIAYTITLKSARSSYNSPHWASLSLAHLSRAFSHRATSRMEDETICASTLLDLDTLALLSIDGIDRNTVEEERMEEFWKQIGGISKGIAFHHSARLKRRGFRWAPRTLMGGRPGNFWRDFDKGIADFKDIGLSISYPGIVFDRGRMMPPPDGRLYVQVSTKPLVYYYIELFPEKDAYLEWLTHSYCALIMFRKVAEGSSWTDAILGIREDDNHEDLDGDYRIPLLFQTRARIRLWSNDKNPDFAITDSLRGVTQKWLVL